MVSDTDSAAIRKKNKFLKYLLSFLIVLVYGGLLCFNTAIAQPQTDEKLNKAIWFYQHGDYEEAVSIFEELRNQNPDSSIIAYYLGMTYKQLQDYLNARPHLEASINLQTDFKDVLIELIDLLYQLDEIEAAKKWIKAAEEKSLDPGQTAFLKGLVLLKEGQDIEGAIKSFEDAKKFKESLTQTAEYYKALAYMQLKNFKEAKNIFREIAIKDPTTDLATFVNEYMNAITRAEKLAAPFHGSVTVGGQFDDNVILKPTDESLAEGVGSEGDWCSTLRAEVEYNLKPKDQFGINTRYSFYDLEHAERDYYDVMTHDLSIQPAFYFKNAAIAFPITCNYTDLNNRKYYTTIGLNNLNNIMLERNHMMQFLLQYNRKDYKWEEDNNAERRDVDTYLWSIGWYRFFGKNNSGFVNIRYAMNYDDAEGDDWEYFGNRFTLSTTLPLMEKVKLSMVGDYFRQDYQKVNSAYNKKRHDDVYTVSSLLGMEIFKNTELQLQYTFVDDLASIAIYKYHKQVVNLGIKYEF